MAPAESSFGVKSSSFFSKPIRVAPLNIAAKQQQHQQTSFAAPARVTSPTSFTPSSKSSILQRPALSSQTFLEANVRLLCDMVDTILRTNESDQKMLRIEVGPPTVIDTHASSSESSFSDPKSPLYILSPKSYTQAKSDISKLDNSVVSKLNSGTLLDLFPTPPPGCTPIPEITNSTISITAAVSSTPQLAIPILERPTTLVVSPSTSWSCPSEDSEEARPKKSSKQNRNWVISSGFFVATSETVAGTEEEGEEKDYTSPRKEHSHESRMTKMEPSKGGSRLTSPVLPTVAIAMPTTVSTATSVLPRPLVARRSIRQEKHHSSFSSAIGSLPAPLMTSNLNSVAPLDPIPSSNNNCLDTPYSPFSSMDALSQSLFNIETQLRRPSFLMNRRTSVLSTLFATNSIALDHHDQQGQHSCVSPTGPIIQKSTEEQNRSLMSISKEHNGTYDKPLDAHRNRSDQTIDWHAWHGSWIRRRAKAEDDSYLLSPTSPIPRTSYSSTRSSSLLSPISPVPRSSYSSIRSSSSFNTNSSSCTSPKAIQGPAPSLVKRLSQRLRRPRLLSSASSNATNTLLSSQFTSPTPPMTPFNSMFAAPNIPTTTIKDADPELWENEGQKWGERFQSLLHNFQPSSLASPLPSLLPPPLPSPPSGKSTRKRWADILSKGRYGMWSGSSSTRSSSETERV
ncbi:hypothetical protein FBU30_000701 [Linnemannia zychae]|nr:hypothetical protein FBU30_000701 [Linnemannia zychae]